MLPSARMPTPRAVRPDASDATLLAAHVRITEECLELEALSAADVRTLRAWIGRINGSTNTQPYLEEEAPGRFRLYVGTAAERARTSKGVQ